MTDKFAIVIPSLNPGKGLPGYVATLRAITDTPIVLVDDGSREELKPIFQQCVSKVENVSLLTHELNKGKGRALKTAFAHLLGNVPGLMGCVTCDSDGQHAPQDVLKCLNALKKEPGAIVLGCRTFNLEHVPWKSRLGNNSMRTLFRLATGSDFLDTQTGLRAIPAEFMRELLECPGERFEFETHMLLRLNGRKLLQVPIETLYVDGNRETHFDPVRDTLKISSIILVACLRKLAKFAIASLLSFGVDIALFTLLYYHVFDERSFGRLLFSVAIARAVSLVFNYSCNRYFVFGEAHGGRNFDAKAFGQYLILAGFIMAASYELTHLCHKALPQIALPVVKVCVDFFLFLASYGVQRMLIFSGGLTRRLPGHSTGEKKRLAQR